VDLVTAEVVSALDKQGVRSIVLKGPSIRRLLYADGAERSYVDSDLLVSPDCVTAAEKVLHELGFSQGYVDPAGFDHANLWIRGGDGARVDLHWTLIGVEAAPQDHWRAFASSTEKMVVGGIEVEVLAPKAIAFQVALHAGQHGPANRRSIADLQRALEILERSTWRAAADLAERLQATELFAGGLRLVPVGKELVAEIGLTECRSVETVLLSRSQVVLAMGLERLARTSGLRGRLILLAREVVPNRAFIRAWWPRAQRGRLWLVTGYLWRPVWLLVHVWPALIAWRRAVRDSGGAGPV
jgi:Uncharacterised nucleotidyltransferase